MKYWRLKVVGVSCIAGALALAVSVVLVFLAKMPAGPNGHQVTGSAGDSATQNAGVVIREEEPSSLIATLSSTVAKFASPGGAQTGTVPGTWFGAPSALPVIAQDAGFLEVRLAQRPNGSTAWIASSSATLSSTPYRIVVDLATEHLMLYKAGQLLMSAPAGVGTVQDPTPTGNFFVALYASPPTSAWGPFIMVTSGHSNAISDYEESGDAILAIHGPLGADGAIGTSGARVSHGCVRLHDSDLVRLRSIPVGTPVQILSN
jgi:lipoprotein-anchoring transpeptidase ErfK/SrfK